MSRSKRQRRSIRMFVHCIIERYTSRSFTLMELLIVIAIIGLLSSFVLSAVRNARESANVAVAGQQQRVMTRAIELYYDDMGFYPPDVNRGWDPGFARSAPWNPDSDAGETPPGGYALPGTDCGHCPSNWEALVASHWNGPYLPTWPRYTPWDGKYDYNYWPEETLRSGCTLPPGIYVGVQGDYEGSQAVPESAEETMIEKGFDAEQCENGESQMLLWSLES